jgi:hypothetical protein
VSSDNKKYSKTCFGVIISGVNRFWLYRTSYVKPLVPAAFAFAAVGFYFDMELDGPAVNVLGV